MGGGVSIERLSAEGLATVAEEGGKKEVAGMIRAHNIDGELAAAMEDDDECFREVANGSHLGAKRLKLALGHMLEYSRGLDEDANVVVVVEEEEEEEEDTETPFAYLEALASGVVLECKCGVLDAESATTTVWTNTKGGGVEQQWRLTKTGYIESRQHNKVLDISLPATAVIVADRDPARRSQKWRHEIIQSQSAAALSAALPAAGTLVNCESGLRLRVEGAVGTAATVVKIISEGIPKHEGNMPFFIFPKNKKHVFTSHRRFQPHA